MEKGCKQSKKFKIDYTDEAEKGIKAIIKSGDKKLLKKLDNLITELEEHPETGTGRPERLKYFKEPTWSRRLSIKHRIVYEIHDDVLLILLLEILGHYSDK